MAPIAARAGLTRLSPPVRRILAHSMLFGLALCIADLLFNFYLASLGYAADTAGLLSTVGRSAGMLLGIPIGLLIDRLGSQRSLVIGLVFFCASWLLMLQARELWALIGAQFLVGASYILAATAITPLLASVTSDEDRASVFGLNASATLIVGLLGSVVGGLLPTAAADMIGVGPQDTAAYRLALAVVIGLGMAAMLPVLGAFPAVEDGRRTGPSVALDQRLPFRRLVRFALAGLLLGVGGGAILPFQNLFFRNVYGLSDASVGVVLALVSLGMGLGALIGAPVTRRTGLRRGAALLRLVAGVGVLLMLVPALAPAIVGFFLRGLFVAASFPMNDALVMRYTPPQQRGMATSLMSVLWSGGWAAAAVVSGVVQLRWGFAPIIVAVALSYALSALAIYTMPVPDER
ncbi:MAG: MFS transporter [Chloroflexales bacterium]|nr:MFS transporter [Chloroflexales bacterium]